MYQRSRIFIYIFIQYWHVRTDEGADEVQGWKDEILPLSIIL